MKVSILTSVFYQQVEEIHGQDRIIFGGAERYLIELAKFLRFQGHEVLIYQAMTGKELIEKEFAGFKIKCIPVMDSWDFQTAPNLNAAFYEMSLDADLRIYFVTFVAWPLVKSPCISISHGIFWDFPGSLITHIYHRDKEEFFNRQAFGVKAVDACVTVDTNVRNFFAAMEPGSERKMHYIPNFVDTQVFKPADGREDGPLRVLYPRRLVAPRGINEFMSLASKFPDIDFLLCGQATSEETEYSLGGIFSKEIPNLKAIHRPMDQMSEVYQAADIAIVPTRAAEGTSLSCLEAMATGMPIITTPVGGLPNLVIDRYNGLLVDLNHDSLSGALEELINNPNARAIYGQRNRQMAVDAFDIELWKQRWLDVIEKVM